MTGNQKTLTVAINALLIVIFLIASLQGGWWLLLILLAASPAFRIYQAYRPAGAGRVAERFAEPGNHRVVLQVTGPNSVLVIREIRRTTGIDLQAAVQLAKDAPVVVRENLSESSAALVVDHLTKAGARAMAAPIGEQ